MDGGGEALPEVGISYCCHDDAAVFVLIRVESERCTGVLRKGCPREDRLGWQRTLSGMALTGNVAGRDRRQGVYAMRFRNECCVVPERLGDRPSNNDAWRMDEGRV